MLHSDEKDIPRLPILHEFARRVLQARLQSCTWAHQLLL